MKRNSKFLRFLFFLFASKTFASNQTLPQQDVDLKKYYWSFGLTGLYHSLRSEDSLHQLKGLALDVATGGGYFAKNYFIFGSLDIKLGPYERSQKIHLDIV